MDDRQVKLVLRGKQEDLMALIGKAKEEGIAIVKMGTFYDPTIKRTAPSQQKPKPTY